MPLPKPLPALQQELRDLLTDDLSIALQATKTYLPEGGARYQQVLALIARLNDANKERYRNTLSADDYQRRVDTIRANSFDLIESLQESDFTAPRPKTTQRKNRNTRRKKQARLWHQPAFWGGLATLVTLLIALLAYLNDLGVFPFRPKSEAQDRAANTRSQAAAACGFPDTFDSTHLYILITRFEDFANDNETECYGRSIESRIDMVKNREKLPVKICYIDSLSPNQSEQADRLRDLYHADLIIWGKLRNAGPECSADGLCLNFQPSDTLIRYAGGEVRKKVDNEYRPNISAADLESGLISMGAESFDAWLISMVNMKIGQRKPEFYRIAEDWPVERKAEEYNRRGALYESVNNFDKAIADYGQAIYLNPCRKYFEDRATLCTFWGDKSTAIVDYDILLYNFPKYAFYYLGRGMAKFEKGEVKDAINDYNQAINLDSNMTLSFKRRAVAYDTLGDYASAYSDYTFCIKKDANDLDAYLARGTLDSRNGNHQAAIADLSIVLAKEPDNLSALIRRGLSYSFSGIYEKALKDYDDAIRSSPDNANLYFLRGLCHKRFGKINKSLKDFNLAVKYDSLDIDNFLYRGDALSQLGHLQKANADYDKAIQLQPNNPDTYWFRANLKSKLKQFENALSDFDRAIALDSLNANYYIDKGVMLSDMGQHAEAYSVYTRAILIDSTNSIPYGNRGIALSGLGNDDAAINDYLTAIRLSANNALYYNNLGNSYSRLGRYAEALEVLNQSLRLDPTFTKAYNNRATANWALGKYLASLRDRVLAIHSSKYSYLFYLYVIGLFLVFKRRKISRLPLIQTLSHHLSRAYLRFRIFLRHL